MDTNLLYVDKIELEKIKCLTKKGTKPVTFVRTMKVYFDDGGKTKGVFSLNLFSKSSKAIRIKT